MTTSYRGKVMGATSGFPAYHKLSGTGTCLLDSIDPSLLDLRDWHGCTGILTIADLRKCTKALFALLRAVFRASAAPTPPGTPSSALVDPATDLHPL